MADIGKTRVKMISVPFNFPWPRSGRVSVVRELGPALLDDAIAEAAIKARAAVPFDPAPAKKAPARRRSTAPKKPANTAADAADERQSDRMDRENLAAADSANGGAAMDDAG